MVKIKRQSIFERHPKTTTSIIIFLLVIFMDILAAYVLSAVGLYQPQFKIERYYRVKHDVYHHTLATNISHSDAQWGPIGYRVNTNSLGFKDSAAREVKLESDKQRIVLMGDSFTEGVGYEYSETFAGQLDNALINRKIEILNAAATSYSPIIYLRKTEYLLNDIGLKFDHMIVFIDISDIEDEAIHYEFDENRNVIYAPSSKENELDERIKQFITQNTILLSNLRILLRKLKSDKGLSKKGIENSLNIHRGLWTHNEAAYKHYGEKGIRLALERMGKLSSLLKEKNIKLTIAVYPWPDQILHGELDSRQVTIWRNWAEEQNVGFINLFSAFLNGEKAEEVIKKYYILGDVHWNKDGHDLVAANVLKYLANH